MRGYVNGLRVDGGLREPGLVSAAVLVLTAVAFFRVALLPEFGVELSMSTFQLGMVTTVFAVGRLVTDLPGGRLADRFSAPRLLATSAAGVAVGSLLLGVSAEVIAVYLAALLLGVSSATTNATGMTFFSRLAGAGRRGTSMAVFSASLLGGQALGPAIAGLLSSAAGWRFAMLMGTVVAVTTAVVLLTAPRRTTGRRDPPPPRPAGEKPRVESLLVLQSVSFAVFLTLGAIPQTFVPLLGAGDLGLSTAAIGLALGMGGLFRFLGTIVGGWLSDRISRKAALLPGLLGQAAGVALLALEPSLVAWLSAIVIMSLCSFAVTVAATIVGDLSEPRRVGTHLGQFRFVGDIGLITGPLVVSALFEGLGRVPAFLFVSVVLVITALLSWRFLPGFRRPAGS